MLPTYHETDLFGRAAVFAGVYDLVGGSEVHGHDFVEIAVVGGGTGWHETASGRSRLAVGDVLVLRPGAWHGFSRCGHLVVANTCLSVAALHAELAFLRDVPGVRELLWRDPVRPGRHGWSLQRTTPSQAAEAVGEIGVLSELLSRPNVNQARLFGQLLTVLSHLVGQEQTGARGHPAVVAAIAQLDAHPEHPWRIEELARLASLDAAYLTRLFRRDVGLAPMSYLARVRAERAAALLTRTDLPAARIGALVGWPDPTYFARRFRTLVGVTPTDYRARIR